MLMLECQFRHVIKKLDNVAISAVTHSKHALTAKASSFYAAKKSGNTGATCLKFKK